MAPSGLKQNLTKFWRKRWVRILVAVPVLVAAIFVEYRLANIPLPVEVEKTISPIKASLIKREVLIVENPFREIVSQGRDLQSELLPRNDTTKGISIAAHFDSARLSDGNMDRLLRESKRDPAKKPPTQGLQQVDYTTDEPAEDSQAHSGAASGASAQPCSAAIALTLADDTRPPKEIQFLQPSDATFGERTLEIKVIGGDLIVQLSVVDTMQPVTLDPTRKPLGAGCSKTVSVGAAWERSFTGPTQLEVVVPAEQSFQVWFSPLPKQNPWPRVGDFHEPFNLITVPPVSASGLQKTIQGSSPPTFPTLKASRVTGEQPLLLRHLRIGAEELQLDISGQAMVQENGKDIVTFDLWKWMKLYPLPAILLSGLQLSLVNWVRLSFKKTPNGPATRRKKRRSRRETKH